MATVIDERGGPDRIEIVLPNEQDAKLVLCRRDNASTDDRPKICLEFQVDDADVEYARLIDLGFEILEPPKCTPWGFKWIYFKDPDGNEVILGSSCDPVL